MGATILLVEDNPITSKLVRFTLENQGFTVVVAADGRSALESFAKTGFSLVLQDLVLPDIDGFELVRRLRDIPGGKEVPILAFSGMISKLEEARVSAVGFDDVVSKPVEPSRLVQLVRAHLPEATAPTTELFGKGHRVLVADDDLVQRKLVAFRMQRVGFEVVLAADGVEALEHVRRVKPDAVVSDVLMPRMDGFGLCMNLRSDERLASVPVILTTSSYVEASDRALALRVGASALVLRTPELTEVMETLRAALGRAAPRVEPSSLAAAEIDSERVHRLMSQLERQVTLNAGVAQRCSLLSAELAVLSGIADALASHDDIDGALRHALAACFDAGGVSLGALYLQEGESVRVLSIGASGSWSDEDLEGFFGERALLTEAIRAREPLMWHSGGPMSGAEERVLTRAGAAAALLVPLAYHDRSLGALLVMSRGLEMNSPDRVMFTRAVAGQIAHALAVTSAFKRQKESERLAQDRAALLRSILDSIADAVVVADEQGRFVEWNPAAEQVLRMGPPGARPSDLWSTRELFDPGQTTPVAVEHLPLYRAMKGEAIERHEVVLRHAGAPEEVWLSVNARPWRDAHQRIRGGVAAFRDVTQEKAVQSQLLASDRMASVGMLAAGVAHEINNPLAALLANLELVQRELLDHGARLGDVQELREMLDDARSAAERVRQIVRDLKIFSRHEEVKPGAIDVRRVLESSLRLAWNEIRHRARVVTEFGDVGLVEGTESRLGQVFLNLIVNAAQAIPEGRADKNTIRVVTRADASGRIAVDISDSGIGIPPDVLPQIFRPFFTTKAVGVGTGLGLAICHRIVTGLGGDLQVESAVGIGTTFKVLLLPSRSAEAAQKPLLERTAPAVRRARVLVVDDEALIGTVIGRCLSAEHEVLALTQATEALERIARGECFDVILCDLMMPVMTGMEFHAHVEKIAPQQAARIIYLTGGAFTLAARTFLDEVQNQRIEKPFDAQHLRALVNDRLK